MSHLPGIRFGHLYHFDHSYAVMWVELQRTITDQLFPQFLSLTSTRKFSRSLKRYNCIAQYSNRTNIADIIATIQSH